MADFFAPYSDLQRRMRAILYKGSNNSGLIFDLARIPDRVLKKAIRDGSIRPIIESSEYRAAILKAQDRLINLHRVMIKRSSRAALQEANVRGISLNDLADRLAISQTNELIREFERKTKSSLRRVVSRYSLLYHKGELDLADLAKELRPHIGLAGAQSRRLELWQRSPAAANLSRFPRNSELRRRWLAQSRNRTRQISDFRTRISVNEAKIEAWSVAIDEGKIPQNAKKQSVTAGDEKVRLPHHRQSEMPPVPINEPFQMFNDMYPPWTNEHGCRCTYRIVLS